MSNAQLQELVDKLSLENSRSLVKYLNEYMDIKTPDYIFHVRTGDGMLNEEEFEFIRIFAEPISIDANMGYTTVLNDDHSFIQIIHMHGYDCPIAEMGVIYIMPIEISKEIESLELNYQIQRGIIPPEFDYFELDEKTSSRLS